MMWAKAEMQLEAGPQQACRGGGSGAPGPLQELCRALFYPRKVFEQLMF